MSGNLERIDALFVDGRPELERCAALERFGETLADRDPQVLVVTTPCGSIVAAVRYGPEPLPDWAEIQERVVRALEEPDSVPAPWRALQSSGAPGDLVLLAWTGKPVGTSAEADARAAVASVVTHAVALTRSAHEAARRLEHLHNEHDALQESHAKVVSELLEAREVQARLERENVEGLEAEVERRSAELRDALAQAEAANDAKSLFLANVSHEIRTPMTAILGYVELIGDPSTRPEESAEYSAIVEDNGRRLLALIDDLLDVSRFETDAAGLARVVFDPAGLLAEVADTFRDAADEKGLSLETGFEGEAGPVLGDAERLRRLLRNLVGNAIKFTGEGGIRILGRRRVLGEAEFLVIEVIDSGMGMSPDEVARLFEPFAQADASSTRRAGGAGLGLPLARSLARAMGGDVTARSEPGRGSTFRVTSRIEPAGA